MLESRNSHQTMALIKPLQELRRELADGVQARHNVQGLGYSIWGLVFKVWVFFTGFYRV